MWGAYFIIAFIVLHYLWKTKAEPAIKKKKKYDIIMGIPEFHIAVWGSLFWIVAVPMMLLWRLLDRITKNYKQKSK